MTDTPWTPGPWEAHKTGAIEEHNYAITAPDGDSEPWWIAKTYFFVQPGMEAANARLIAAAPEMAEALDAVAVDMQCGDGTMTLATAHKVAALLAHIRGATP